MKVFVDRLKWLRNKKRMSQNEVAEKLGMSLSGYQKIEYEQRDPNLERIVDIVKIFNESSDFLLGIKDEDRESESLKERLVRINQRIDSIRFQLFDILKKENRENTYEIKEEFKKMRLKLMKELDELENDKKILLERLLKVMDEIPHTNEESKDFIKYYFNRDEFE